MKRLTLVIFLLTSLNVYAKNKQNNAGETIYKCDGKIITKGLCITKGVKHKIFIDPNDDNRWNYVIFYLSETSEIRLNFFKEERVITSFESERIISKNDMRFLCNALPNLGSIESHHTDPINAHYCNA